MVAVPPPPQRTAAALVAQGLAYDLSRDHRGAHWPQTEQRRGSPHVPTSPRPSLVAERKEPKVCVTLRWRKGDSNSRSHPDGELSQRVVLVDICDGAPATTADRGTQVRTRLAAGGDWIRTTSTRAR